MRTLAILSKILLIGLISLFLLTNSSLPPGNQYEQVRAYTRMREFNYVDWSLDALLLKSAHSAVDAPRYMTIDQQRAVVLEFIDLVRWINQTNTEIEQIYSNPYIGDPAEAAVELETRLKILNDMERKQQPLAEAVLQTQISTILAEYGFGIGGQPLPPVLYHVTRLPNALIVSPRGEIRQDHNISLLPAITLEDIIDLENSVETRLDVSALVVAVGGVATYPSMVMSTTNLPYLLEVIAHEWAHNYLTLRPLGVNYMTTPQLRTINETTASITGKEIGRAALERFYPEIAADLAPLAPPAPPVIEPETAPGQPTPEPPPEDPTGFNYYREMRKTRVRADELLAAGKIVEAEEYLEARRKDFWDNGYQIRRLNQAFFAFNGAYDDVRGGGAAGRDPVGPTVQMLRYQSRSLSDFLFRISWITSFDALQDLVGPFQ